MARYFLCLTILFGALSSLRAAERTFESGPAKTRLLELYTSEGCSSCPPAEAWLSRLKDSPRLWHDFAPIAFHVDYWDRLGWRDPFASKTWTERQYQYSARWNSESVYTPGFVLDGREWRNGSLPPASAESPGILKVDVGDADIVKATFASRGSAEKPLELHVARLGFGLNVNVKAGENGGRKLQHDFVVLALEKANLNSGKASVHLPASPSSEGVGQRSALVAWVTEPGQLESIQATGGWLR